MRSGSTASPGSTASSGFTDPRAYDPQALDPQPGDPPGLDRGDDGRRPGRSVALRLAVLVTAFSVLLISGAASLQVYFRQQRQIAELRTSIVEREQAIGELEGRISQWDDPAYVEQQARERFGWVMPGETGYRVIGPDGTPIEGARLDSDRIGEQTPEADAWWLKLWSGTRTADRPLPGGTPVGTPGPSASPTPTAQPTP